MVICGYSIMAIGGYFIGGYSIKAIGGYSTNGYWRLFY